MGSSFIHLIRTDSNDFFLIAVIFILELKKQNYRKVE